MRTFTLERDVDETGISGTGTVAEGVEFTDGQVALAWIVGEYRSTVLWPQGMAAVEAIHGHGGKTRIVYGDGTVHVSNPAIYVTSLRKWGSFANQPGPHYDANAVVTLLGLADQLSNQKG